MASETQTPTVGTRFVVMMPDEDGQETGRQLYLKVVAVIFHQDQPYYVVFQEASDGEPHGRVYLICCYDPDGVFELLPAADPRIEPIVAEFTLRRAKEALGVLHRLHDAKEIEIVSQDPDPMVIFCDDQLAGYAVLRYAVENVEMRDYALFSLVDAFGDELTIESTGFVIEIWIDGSRMRYGEVVNDEELIVAINERINGDDDEEGDYS